MQREGFTPPCPRHSAEIRAGAPVAEIDGPRCSPACSTKARRTTAGVFEYGLRLMVDELRARQRQLGCERSDESRA
jgi:hypothetical protein